MAGILEDSIGGATRRQRLTKSQGLLGEHRTEQTGDEMYLRGLTARRAFLRGGFGGNGPDLFARLSAVVYQNHVAARDAYVFHAAAIRWRRLRGYAEWKSQSIFACPLNLQYRLTEFWAEAVLIWMVERINRRNNLGKAHRLTVARIGILRDPVLGTFHFFEDQYVAGFEFQHSLRSGRSIG